VLGDYVLHFPLTDFAVSLLVLAAFIDIGRLILKRPSWTTTVDVLLVTGFLGALAAIGSGLWLVSTQLHVHDDLLATHHWFAYGTLGAASASVVARLLQKRSPVFGAIKTATLVVAALLVSGAGFYGGKMAHPVGEAPHHDAMPHDHGSPRDEMAPQEGAQPDARKPTAETPPHGHESTPRQH
jgi:hypothetical protein